MFRKKLLVCMISIVSLTAFAGTAALANGPMLTPKQLLGMFIYMDESLSDPVGQSCMSCHHPKAAFVDPANTADPVSSVVSVGADGVSLGGRNAPTAAYAAFSPAFYWDDGEQMYIGGQFWDGRAATLAEQAKGPFLNPVEMNNTMEGVVRAIRRAPYAWLFLKVFGWRSLDNVESAYNHMADAIAAFESSGRLNRFTSKYDFYLAGKARLTPKELKGLDLFNNKAGCAACHPSTVGPYHPTHALFTDFSYDNLGIPLNDKIPYEFRVKFSVDEPWDYGLGGRSDIRANDPNYADQIGKHKVSTLRNIAKTAPYGHNGFFATLQEIVEFYNTAGISGLWPAPEVDQNVNRTELGDLGLTADEVDALVAFLHTLSDGYSGALGR
jgi:cytochrome c peroxidase